MPLKNDSLDEEAHPCRSDAPRSLLLPSRHASGQGRPRHDAVQPRRHGWQCPPGRGILPAGAYLALEPEQGATRGSPRRMNPGTLTFPQAPEALHGQAPACTARRQTRKRPQVQGMPVRLPPLHASGPRTWLTGRHREPAPELFDGHSFLQSRKDSLRSFQHPRRPPSTHRTERHSPPRQSHVGKRLRKTAEDEDGAGPAQTGAPPARAGAPAGTGSHAGILNLCATSVPGGSVLCSEQVHALAKAKLGPLPAGSAGAAGLSRKLPPATGMPQTPPAVPAALQDSEPLPALAPSPCLPEMQEGRHAGPPPSRRRRTLPRHPRQVKRADARLLPRA